MVITAAKLRRFCGCPGITDKIMLTFIHEIALMQRLLRRIVKEEAQSLKNIGGWKDNLCKNTSHKNVNVTK